MRFDLRVAELSGGLLAFGDITVVATEREVAYTIGAMPRAWHNMVQFKNSMCAPTVRAAILKLFQEICPDLPAKKLTTLVFDPCHLRVLHEGQVKLDPLHLDPADRRPVGIALCPGEHVSDP